MRLALTADHKEFFLKNNYIEFEGLLTPEQVAILKKNAEEALASRLKLNPSRLKDQPTKELFQAGYDLWRGSAAVKKTVHKKEFALLASELFQTIPIRCAFDQYISTALRSASPFPETLTLQESSCLSPLAGALVLPLDDLMKPIPSFPMPMNAGSGLFIAPALEMPWPELFAAPNFSFLIIGYSGARTLFAPDTRDPRAVNVKMLGYVFNENLNDAKHPILLRKS